MCTNMIIKEKVVLRKNNAGLLVAMEYHKGFEVNRMAESKKGFIT